MTKNDLYCLRDKKKTLDGFNAAIESLEAKVTDISVHLSDMPRSGAYRDALAEYVSSRESLEIALLKIKAEYMALFARVEEWLVGLPYQQQIIMRLRYEEGLSWSKIAERSHYAQSYCETIHTRALKKLP